MDLGLAGQTAVVFGAARGLGYAIAKEFGSEGMIVSLVDRLPNVIDACHGIPGASAHVLDVTDYQAVQHFAENRPTDHLVFAVGMGSGHFGFPYWNVPIETWDRVLQVNLTAAANVACAYGPRMAHAGRGTMLFLASVAGQIGSQTDPPYSAAKAGLINFAQCAAKDLAPYGVRVNIICPGMIPTELNRSVWQAWADRQSADTWQSYETWAAEKIRKVVPLQRWQTPEDVAAMAVFLISSRAANITGQTINVDGGFVMHS
jgi:NAD(P)-dependent dehydrogenase (short-subunit alcohol dehydrogenase family)